MRPYFEPFERCEEFEAMLAAAERRATTKEQRKVVFESMVRYYKYGKPVISRIPDWILQNIHSLAVRA